MAEIPMFPRGPHYPLQKRPPIFVPAPNYGSPAYYVGPGPGAGMVVQGPLDAGLTGARDYLTGIASHAAEYNIALAWRLRNLLQGQYLGSDPNLPTSGSASDLGPGGAVSYNTQQTVYGQQPSGVLVILVDPTAAINDATALATPLLWLASRLVLVGVEMGTYSLALAQSLDVFVSNLVVDYYNSNVGILETIYNAQAQNLNRDPAVQNPQAYVQGEVAKVAPIVIGQINALVKVVTDTVVLAQDTVAALRRNTVDPAVAGATATVNKAILDAQTAVAKAQQDVGTALGNAGQTINQRLTEAVALVNSLDETVLDLAGDVGTEVQRIKTATVDPAVANAIGIVTGALSAIVTLAGNLRQQVEGIVAQAPGEVDRRVEDVLDAVEDASTLAGQIAGTAVQAANQVRTGTVDPLVATATAIINGYLTALGPGIAQATAEVTAAVANAQTIIGQNEAVVRAEVAKQQAAAEKTITDTMVYAQGQIANTIAILGSQIQVALGIVGQAVGIALAEVTRVMAQVNAQTVDRPLFYGALSSPVVIGAPTDVVVIPPGGLTITAD